MHVKTRHNLLEPVCFDKITNRIRALCDGLSSLVDPTIIAQDTVSAIYDGISTSQLDEISATICAGKVHDHPDYGLLGGRIIASNISKNTFEEYEQVVDALYRDGQLSDKWMTVYNGMKDQIQEMFDYSRDYLFDYFAMKTLTTSFLLKVNGVIVERPQHMYMRVAIQVHGSDLVRLKETYDYLSQLYFTHATPTLFNSGSKLGQLASCFLLGMDDDLTSIFKTMGDIAQISKLSGGIGLSLSNIRCAGSIINGTKGKSSGLLPLCKTLEQIARYINQGGKRKGSIACFVEDTEVCTVNEGVKKIQDVKIGDLVVTHKNRVRPVVQVHKNPLVDRKIYKVEVEKNKDIYVTGNHEFWSCEVKNTKNKKTSLGWNTVEGLKEMMDAQDNNVRQACYIAFPEQTSIPETKQVIDVMDYMYLFPNKRVEFIEEDGVSKIRMIQNKKGRWCKPVNRFWNITNDFANFIGMWLGDGHIATRVIGIGFTVHNMNQDEIDYISKICKDVFGIIPKYDCARNTTTTVLIHSCIIGHIFKELFGSGFAGKKLPDMVFGWSHNLVHNLMAGLITTDGHISMKCSISLGLSNQNLMNQLYHLCRNNGLDVSLLKCNLHKGQTTHSYSMSIPVRKEILEQTHKIYTDDRIQRCYDRLEEHDVIGRDQDMFLKIQSITETDRTDEFVYTIGVEEDHSYVVEGLVVKNCYLEPWHGDIEMFIEMRKPTGDENLRARDLFSALWVPDLFMKRVEEGREWSLFCPNTCPLLYSTYGEEFEKLYETYEKEGKAIKVIQATELWSKILESQTESGMPYISYKDQVNRRNMQKHLGVIRNSNLCVVGSTKIMIKTSEDVITQVPISELQDQQVEVWNGEEWSGTTVRKTASEQDVVRVTFTNGAYIDCTGYHRFPLQGGKVICASDLHPRMVLQEYELPKVSLQIETVYKSSTLTLSSRGTVIPFDAPVHEKILWFTEYCKEMMAQVRCHKERIYISDPIATPEGKDTLLDIRLFLQTLGVDSKIFVTSDKRLELQFYPHSLFELGFQTTLDINQHPPFYNDFSTLVVQSIQPLSEKQDTYCFTESKRNMGMFNGILTMNCNEISLYSDAKSTSVCNLASICLPKFIEKNDKGVLAMNFEKLQGIARILTRNLNLVIDKNYHPTPEAEATNIQNRPIGIGVQGLSCCFALLKLPFDSKGARELNRLIFEHIYYGAVKESIEMAKTDGPYPSYSHPDCPHRQGLLHFMIPSSGKKQETTLDWEPLVRDLIQYGIRNSVLTALMPTASTSQICGNNECFEPITSNLYLRSTMSGEFLVVNKHLVRDLIEAKLWTKEIYEQIVYWDGSIQKIVSIPLWIRELYKTASELKTTSILNLAIDRGGFVDQTQSMNIFMPRDLDRLHSSHFYAWKGGLKTGMYYLRTQAATTGNKFGLDVLSIKRIEEERNDLIKRVNTKTSPGGGPVPSDSARVACPRDPALREICDSCSS